MTAQRPILVRVAKPAPPAAPGGVDGDVTHPTIEWRGECYAIEEASKPDPWAGYDPEKARAAFLSLRGLLKGIDIEQLKADLAEERE